MSCGLETSVRKRDDSFFLLLFQLCDIHVLFPSLVCCGKKIWVGERHKAPEGPITDVTVVSCKTGRALWARLQFSVGGFLCSFPRQWTTLGVFPKKATCNLPFLYSAVPAKSGFVKMVSEVPGVYVYNRVEFWIQRIVKRFFTSGILECCGKAGQFPSARDCPTHCGVKNRHPLTVRGSTPTPYDSQITPSNSRKFPGELSCPHRDLQQLIFEHEDNYHPLSSIWAFSWISRTEVLRKPPLGVSD